MIIVLICIIILILWITREPPRPGDVEEWAIAEADASDDEIDEFDMEADFEFHEKEKGPLEVFFFSDLVVVMFHL
jgi:hypothetical protein